MKPILKFFLFLILFVGFVLPGCDKDNGVDCNCPDIIGDYFDIESVALHNFRILDNGSRDEIHNENIEVEWDDYFIQTEFGVSYFGDITAPPSRSLDFSLMPAAYGCSCIGNGSRGSLEKYSDIKVITRNDFDENHLANDTINSLVNIAIYGNDNMDLNEFLESDTNNIMAPYFFLDLKSGPTLSDEFSVDVLIRLNNGDEFLASNGVVKFK